MLRTLENTVGAAYVGVIASAILFGVTNLQTFIYFRTYTGDKLYVKISVGVLWVLDAFSLFLSAHAVYHYLVIGFGNFSALEIVGWSIKLQVAVNVVMICSVQSLYAIRVWRFSRIGGPYYTLISWFVSFMVACGYGVGVVLVIATYKLSSYLFVKEISWAIYVAFATSTGIDIAIAATMCFFLQLNRTPSGYSCTNSILSTLTQYILGSGLATSVCSVTALITYATMPHNLIFLSIQFLLTKLYANSFLAMLNARQSLRERNDTGDCMPDSLSLSRLDTAVCTVRTPTSATDSVKNIMTFSPREDDQNSEFQDHSVDATHDDSISVYHWASEIP